MQGQYCCCQNHTSCLVLAHRVGSLRRANSVAIEGIADIRRSLAARRSDANDPSCRSRGLARLPHPSSVTVSPSIAHHRHPVDIDSSCPGHDAAWPRSDVREPQLFVARYRARVGRRHAKIDAAHVVLTKGK